MSKHDTVPQSNKLFKEPLMSIKNVIPNVILAPTDEQEEFLKSLTT